MKFESIQAEWNISKFIIDLKFQITTSPPAR